MSRRVYSGGESKSKRSDFDKKHRKIHRIKFEDGRIRSSELGANKGLNR